MSEVNVFLRQGDNNRASIKTPNKRPLSIITENDSDDSDTIDYTKFQNVAESSDKENISFCEDTSEPNKTAKGNEVISEVPGPVSGSICLSPVSNKNAFLETSSVTSLDDKEDTTPNGTYLTQTAIKEQIPRLTNSEIQNCKERQCSLSSLTGQNDISLSCDFTQINGSTWPKTGGGDSQRLARIRETSERLHFTSPVSTTSPMPSSTNLISKFGHRMWTQTSTQRSLHQSKSPTGQSLQQISLTPNGVPSLVVSLTSNSESDETADNDSSNFFTDNLSLSEAHLKLGSAFTNPKLKSTKLSSYFSRRMSNESTGSLSESDLSDGDIGSDDNATTYLSYFRRLKETTDRLSLSTRRPSIMLWRQQYMEFQGSPQMRSAQNGDATDDRLTSDRKQRIDLALDWLRSQLQEMRNQDQTLARQLLAIRNDIHKLKLQRSTEEHQELIDDFQFELQELQELSDVLDLPLPEYGDNPLKHIGVTRLNISARRFSAC